MPGAGVAGESFVRPTDVAWDKAGNIYVADGYGNARVAKYEPNGKYIKSWGSRGSATGQFNIVHGIAIDGQGNVYVADEGNKRIQVFDTEGTFKKAFDNVGSPTAICLTTGAKPVLYVAHTGDPDGMEDAAIYKLDLDGNVLGKFGKAGKELKQFGLVNAIDCRNENELLIGELSNWRVQRVTLQVTNKPRRHGGTEKKGQKEATKNTKHTNEAQNILRAFVDFVASYSVFSVSPCLCGLYVLPGYLPESS